MLEFHPVTERPTPPARLAELFVEARRVLVERGMASMDEYGDMLKWGLPRVDGVWRNIHVFHPDWCSYSDRFWGTIHFHAGWIRGTVLAGAMEHYTYRAVESPDGDRFHGGRAYTLARHTDVHREGATYELPARVPHWIKPTALTLTYFEEQETEDASDLVNPASEAIDEHRWTQAQADALLPELLALIDDRLARLAPAVPGFR
ncbi:MAG TPA: hypothetical protein VM889_06230 [Candidatus Thermoplasmatota archaeon]|nr:hypothetical protein [Candidatus Thermoplasmatota archaeon]